MHRPTRVHTEHTMTSEIPSESDLRYKFLDCTPDGCDDTPKVTSVKFSISCRNFRIHTIHFKKPVTEKEAVTAAEIYLSEPLTKVYFDLVMEDTLGSPWWSYINLDDCRGDCRMNARIKRMFDTSSGYLILI